MYADIVDHYIESNGVDVMHCIFSGVFTKLYDFSLREFQKFVDLCLETVKNFKFYQDESEAG
jgi:hypothetical protein